MEQETLLEHAGLFNLYATRGEAGDEIRSDSRDVEACRHWNAVKRARRQAA